MWATLSVHSFSSKPQWKYSTTKGAFSLWTWDECRLPPGASPRMCFWALRVVTCCFATHFAHMFHRSHWSFQQLEWSSIGIKKDISLTSNFSIAWWWNFPGPPQGQLHHIFFFSWNNNPVVRHRFQNTAVMGPSIYRALKPSSLPMLLLPALG